MKIFHPFLLLSLISVFIQAAFQYLLISDQLYFNALSEQLAYERIEELISQGKRWQWVGYAAVPVIYLIKFTLIAACLSIGHYLFTDRYIFRTFFEAVVMAELIFLVPMILKLLYFLFVHPDYTLNELGQFYPLSLLSVLNASAIEPYWLYPLQVLNLFEVAYWFLLAYNIREVLEKPFAEAFRLVAASYGSGLLLWVVLMVFLTVTWMN